MLRISRLTDYGIVVMAYLANHAAIAHTAKTIALHTRVSLPTVSKLLKLLARGKLLDAQRGSKGGYRLAGSASHISLAQIIQAIEGEEISLTACGHSNGLCEIEKHCTIRSNWVTISQAIRETLEKISLAEMNKPIYSAHLQKHFSETLCQPH